MTTGGSIWTLATLLSDALRFGSASEWAAMSPAAFAAAESMGLLRECLDVVEGDAGMSTPVRLPRKWTREDVLADAAPHDSITSWRKSDKRAYHAAHKMGLLAEATAHMERRVSRPKKQWTREGILADASSHATKTEWFAASRSAYNAAKRLGCFTKATSHMKAPPKKPSKWTRESVLADAERFGTKTEWSMVSNRAYQAAKRLGCFAEATAHMEKARRAKVQKQWTPWRILEDALRFATKSEWHRRSRVAYDMSKRLGCFASATAHMRNPRIKWTRRTILLDAGRFGTKSAWSKASQSAVAAAKKLGCFASATAHMRNPRIKWTPDAIIADAERFGTKTEWCKLSGRAYEAAKRLGCFAEATAHMTRARGGRKRRA